MSFTPTIDFHNVSLLRVVIAFVCMFVTDFIWARYIKLTNDGNAAASATYGTLTLAFGVVVSLNYLNNMVYFIPAIAGAWLGTYYTVKRHK